MIGLATIAYDIYGDLLFDADIDSSINDFQRRVSRTATLDGNSSITDLGYSPGDLTFSIKISNIDNANIVNLERIVRLHSALRISTRHGVYRGVISRLFTDRLPVELTFLVSSKLSTE